MRTLMECIVWTILLTMMILCASVHGDELKVGVIDTGLDITDTRLNSRLCPNSSQDFTGTGLVDHHGHGTHVVGIIENRAKDANYCLAIFKFYDKNLAPEADLINALKEAISQKLDIVNMSLGGKDFDQQEKDLICNNPHIKFIVSAGNDNEDLGKTPTYPASYHCDNEVIVGATGDDYVGAIGQPKAWFSNYGDIIDVWEPGSHIRSTLPNGQEGEMSGTSMSAASITGKAIYLLDKYVKNR
jgi:major intracellular serine protease